MNMNSIAKPQKKPQKIDQSARLGYRLLVMRQMILSVALIVLGALLTASILLQQRGSGLGAAFGGEGNIYRTKRGLERSLFYATIALACLFFGVAILNLIFV
jgi:preprotein translocase subunit SecG